MATNQSLTQAMNQTPANNQNRQPVGLKALLSSDTVQKKFKDILKDKSAGFTSSVLTLVNNDSYLAKVEPMSILTGAMIAAQLDLPLDKNLGYAYIIPFKGKAQFILGYKGYIQLAQRSGQYKSLNVINVYEGELTKWNRLTEEIELDFDSKASDRVIGYVAHFELLNGFKKTTYWSRDEVEAHRRKNAKGNNKSATGVWASDFDAMAQKTLLRNILSKWGILSIEMQKAFVADENEVEFTDEGDLVDVTPEDDFERLEEPAFDPTEAINDIEVDPATGEIIEQEQLFDTGVRSKLDK